VRGSVLGNYLILEQIGEGGMGVVYVGRHEKLGQRVIVKVLRPELSSEADVVQRFFNEAQAAAAIQHPGIAQVFDVGTANDGHAYIVMELLKGETLAERLKERRLDAEACCRIGRQIANVLSATHAAGITHRDLKPDNLFLVPDAEVVGGERVKVLDFGIAKLTGDSRVKTSLGVAMGTPRYMSPEQCRSASLADARSDIYSLGCVLFKMACGRPPFIEKDMVELMTAQLSEPPPDPLHLVPDLPPELSRLILRMLEKEPGARPQTMLDVSHALDEIQRSLGGGAARISRPRLPGLPLPLVTPESESELVPTVPSSQSGRLAAMTERQTTTLLGQGRLTPGRRATTQPGPSASGPDDQTEPSPGGLAAVQERRASSPSLERRLPTDPPANISADASDDQVTTRSARLSVPPGAPLRGAQESSPAVVLPRPSQGAPGSPMAAPLPAAAAAKSSSTLPAPQVKARASSPQVGLQGGPQVAPQVEALVSPPPAAQQPESGASETFTTTISGATGVLDPKPRRRASRLPWVLGGIALLGAIAVIAIVLMGGGSREGAGQVSKDEGSGSLRAGRAGSAADPAALVPAPTAPAPPVVDDPAVEVLAADDPAAACIRLQREHKWSELARCADGLASSDPKRAAELRTSAAEEARSAPRVAAFEAALRGNNLKQAWAELGQIWPASIDLPGLRRKYIIAEAHAIDDLAARLARVKSGDCKAYGQLLTQEQAAAPPRVAAEAARRTGCTPRTCDGDALAQTGQGHYVVSRLPEALAAYESAIACRQEPEWIEKAFLIACNLTDRGKARLYWGRLPALRRARIVGICDRNGITEAQLNGP
jgi:serine/threonine-protein kinase